jgi:hypothetical protein
MPQQRGTPEVRAAYVAAMGDELARQVLEIEVRVDEIEDRWALLIELYGTSAPRLGVLRRVSPMTFGLLEDLLWENLVTRLSHVANGPANRWRPPVGLSTLPPLVSDAAFRPKLAVLIGRARIAIDGVRRHRDKSIASPDGIMARSSPAGLPDEWRAGMQQAIEAVVAVLQAVSRHYLGADRRPAHHVHVAAAAAQLFASLQDPDEHESDLQPGDDHEDEASRPMSRTIQIRCVRRTQLLSACERISHIGSDLADGSWWMLPHDEAVGRVEAGRLRFFTQLRGRFVWVVVATLNGRKYLKSEVDGEQPMSLLALPECPSTLAPDDAT